MDWKRRLELTCGLITAVLGIIVMLGALTEAQTITQRLQEPASFGKSLVVSFALYGLPALLVTIGAYAHTTKRQQWGRMVLIASSLFPGGLAIFLICCPRLVEVGSADRSINGIRNSDFDPLLLFAGEGMD